MIKRQQKDKDKNKNKDRDKNEDKKNDIKKEFKIIYILTKYKSVEIDEFILTSEFKEMNSQERINFLINKESNFIYSLKEEQIKIIELINKIRIKNNIDKLKYRLSEKLENYFLIEKNIRFFVINNTIKLDKKQYLFIFPIGEFKKKLINKDKNIIKIILLIHLNSIIILVKEEKEYILIYEEKNIPKNTIHIISTRNNKIESRDIFIEN